MCDNSGKCVTTVVPFSEVAKFHFVLKLWLLTNNEEVEYLRWNQDKTVVVIDVALLRDNLQSDMVTCQSVEDFLWLLNHHGFQQCPPTDPHTALKCAEGIENRTLVSYRHSKFVRSNAALFDGWLEEVCLGSGARYGKGTSPRLLGYQVPFRPIATTEEFQKGKAKTMAEMKLLDMYIRREYDIHVAQQTTTISIPLQYSDDSLMEAPVPFQTDLVGSYGSYVDPGELNTFFGIKQEVVQEVSIADTAKIGEYNVIPNGDTEQQGDAVEYFYVNPDGRLSANLELMTSAVSEFENVSASMDYTMLEACDSADQRGPIDERVTKEDTFLAKYEEESLDSIEMKKPTAFLDPETPTFITNSVRSLIDPLDID